MGFVVFDHFEVDVKGATEVERALDKLTPDAQRAVEKEKKRLAKNLAAKLRRAVISGSKGRMGTKVRPTIRQSGDTVIAGPHPMLFGTEFGANGRYGWYADDRFRDSPARQYFRHQGDGYWWQPTIRRAKPDADAAVQRALDDALSHWSA